MSKRKILSYFESERNKNNITEGEKPENEFHDEDDDAQIPNSKTSHIPDEMVEWTQMVTVREY